MRERAYPKGCAWFMSQEREIFFFFFLVYCNSKKKINIKFFVMDVF